MTTQQTPNCIHDIDKHANNSRIEAIQSYANEHGMVLPLSKMSRGLDGIGYPNNKVRYSISQQIQ